MAVSNPFSPRTGTPHPAGETLQGRNGSVPHTSSRSAPARNTLIATAEEAQTSMPGRSKLNRFLVVDDDETFRTRLVKALQTRGLEAQGAGDARQAIEIARQFRPQAAIVDLKMPGESGLDLAPQLASQFPNIQIVVLTGYGSIATAVEAVRRGAVNYLTKPLDTDQ